MKTNLTTLGQNFQNLNIDIENELLDIGKVNEVLQKAATVVFSIPHT
jgi:hypothetical protein